jgi:hypothetical protein
VTPGIPVATTEVPPGQKQRTYSPISSTLIYGKHDAVLIDAFLTVEQSDDLLKSNSRIRINGVLCQFM